MPTLTLDSDTLFYFESLAPHSQRPPLLLLHGAGGQYTHWPPHLRRLPNTTVYAPDLPGHGNSGGTPRLSIAGYAADALALMDALDLEQAIVGGHSMGGAIALTLALDHPDRLAGLLLVASGARLRVSPDILSGLQTNFETAVDLIVQRAFGPDASGNLLRLGRRQLLKCPPEVIHADYAACDAFDVMSRLSEIRMPTLVLAGTADQMTPEKYARYLAENIPGAQLALVEGAGHMVAIESPQQVAALVDDWLGTLEER